MMSRSPSPAPVAAPVVVPPSAPSTPSRPSRPPPPRPSRPPPRVPGVDATRTSILPETGLVRELRALRGHMEEQRERERLIEEEDVLAHFGNEEEERERERDLETQKALDIWDTLSEVSQSE
ncbi:hypothetical protein KIPB_008753, partial [Kipferlia bialata]|eukprot:g8753.t1